jgi:hypothetical protein
MFFESDECSRYMERRTIAVGLLLASLAVFGFATTAQPADVHEHRTGPSTDFPNASFAESHGFTVVSYENISERGRTIYRKTLENDGVYRVPLGEGAAEFEYVTDEELANTENVSTAIKQKSVVIERPANASLPPADEVRSNSTLETMSATTTRPPLSATAWVPLFASVGLGVLLVLASGYLWLTQ